MVKRMKRTQILFPEEQFRLLEKEAAQRKCSIGLLVREAVTKEYTASSREKRLEAARRLAAMNLPVLDWEELEKEIERGFLEGSLDGWGPADPEREEDSGRGMPDG